jgi:hypothetical protein
MKKKSITLSIITLITLGIIASITSNANAQLISFAQFSQINSNRPFIFTNSGSSSALTLASTPVNFIYLVNNGYNNTTGTLVNAHMTISSVVDSTVVSTGSIPNRNFDQAMTNVVIQFTADTPINGLTNLLTIFSGAGMTSSGGSLNGREGRTTGNFEGSESPLGGDSILMTSDFLDFSNTTQRDYSVALNAITPAMGRNANGYLNNFSANATGTFASDPPPLAAAPAPEPCTLALGVLGLINGAFARRRKEK